MSVAGHLGIEELRDLCDRRSAADLGWFEVLGRAATDGGDPVGRRHLAEAAHRRAWHAELWTARRPRVPPEEPVVAPPPRRPDGVDGADPAAAHRRDVDEVRDELRALLGRVDPDLDPSTVRTVRLVLADLDELADRG